MRVIMKCGAMPGLIFQCSRWQSRPPWGAVQPAGKLFDIKKSTTCVMMRVGLQGGIHEREVYMNQALTNRVARERVLREDDF
jgi:hypothetical protein